MRAILSVSDKTGLMDFAWGLSASGIEVYSTGGTRQALQEAGISVRGISELTGFPEIMDGRVKTLHPAVHGGILARRSVPHHLEELQRNGIGLIDLVAVSLYPFKQTVAKPEVTLGDALENIDIGGPTMIRAAAKNFPDVIVIVDPTDYGPVLEKLRRGDVSLDDRKRLAQKAFQHVAAYDTAIAQYLRADDDQLPKQFTMSLRKRLDLRYGENPHQRAAFYEEETAGRVPWGIASADQLWGKELSFNNILDSEAAWNAASDFSEPTVAVIKHTNPCGLASHEDLAEAYSRAFQGDTVSAFGGIVALNRPVTVDTAREISSTFYEVIIAPEYEEKALEVLKHRKDVRILLMKEADSPTTAWTEMDYRRVSGGLLVQTADNPMDESKELKTVTKREPTDAELSDLLFAWRAVKHVKSNAIVLARDKTLLGMGAGQPNRVTSVRIALEKAGERSGGSVLGSDAFFPFPDGVEEAGKGGVTAIIQPGGSMRDSEAIEMADKYGIAMVFSGMRHFRH